MVACRPAGKLGPLDVRILDGGEVVPLFARVGKFVVRHPVWVIVAWVIVAAAVIGFAPKLTSTSDEASFLPTHYESIQATELQQKAFPQAATPAALIVVERSDGGQLNADDSAK